VKQARLFQICKLYLANHDYIFIHPFKSYALGDCSTIEGNDLPATAQGNGSLEKKQKKKKSKD
jgi:hypothetical protein